MHSPIKSHHILGTLVILAWVVSLPLGAQNYKLSFEGNASDLKLLEKYHLKQVYSDSLLMWDQVRSLRQELHIQGYLQAHLKPAWNSAIELQVTVDLGPQYQWLYLRPGNVQGDILQQIGFNERSYRDKPFGFKELEDLFRDLVDFYSETGYPFASVRLDSVQIADGSVAASLAFDPGPLITFDSINVNQGVLSSRFLQTYLQIRPGSPFSESSVKAIASKLNRLPYLRLQDSPQLSFQNNQATTYLSLEKQRAHQIDGVLGFLPNARNNGRLILTGQFNLLLQNMFGGGRRFGLQWESYKPQSQLLNVEFYQPLLFQTPMNGTVGFKLLKEDTTFVNTSLEIDFNYLLRSYGKIRIFSHIKNSRLSATSTLEAATELGDLADVDLNEFGLGYEWSKLDHYLNPRKGTRIEVQLSAGNKKLRRNGALNDSLYREVDFTSTQVAWELRLEKFWPMGKRWVLAGKFQSGAVHNQRLFFNDLFRLGGLKSLRGFSENTFFAAEYLYSTVEPRFYFDQDSYLFAFYDQAWWLEYSLFNQQFEDRPGGFGAGISLTTNAGRFNFAWAIGKSNTQNLGVRQSKIHFGYVTKF